MGLTHVHLFYDFQQELQRYPQRFQNAIDKRQVPTLLVWDCRGGDMSASSHHQAFNTDDFGLSTLPANTFSIQSLPGIYTLLLLFGLLSARTHVHHDDISGDVQPKSIPGLHPGKKEKKGEVGVHKLS
jgi:hypothetical protein